MGKYFPLENFTIRGYSKLVGYFYFLKGTKENFIGFLHTVDSLYNAIHESQKNRVISRVALYREANWDFLILEAKKFPRYIESRVI